MERFTDQQAEGYWKTQRARAGALDQEKDPDSLGNVCHAGAPLWFNEYYAQYQRDVFEHLLSECPRPVEGSTALDIGCGAGRWCRTLHARGYAVMGIDLQQELIVANRKRYPDITFECVSILDFEASAMFDLVTTVTVLQHIPFQEQRRAILNIASMVKTGGRVLILENVRDQNVHVFAQTISAWQELFGEAGFKTLNVRRYDYSPATRISGAFIAAAANVARRLGLMRKSNGVELPRANPEAEAAGNRRTSPVQGALRNIGWLARKAALTVDHRVEPLLIRMNAELPTVHCGFLFEKSR